MHTKCQAAARRRAGPASRRPAPDRDRGLGAGPGRRLAAARYFVNILYIFDEFVYIWIDFGIILVPYSSFSIGDLYEAKWPKAIIPKYTK